MDRPRRTWIDSWQSRNGSNRISSNNSFSDDPPAKSLRSPEYFTPQDNVREFMMDRRNRSTADNISKIGNGTATSVEAQVNRNGMLISPRVSMQQPVNDRTEPSEISNRVGYLRTTLPESRNQLRESRWATANQPKGQTSFAKRSAITTHAPSAKSDTSDKQQPKVQSRKTTPTGQFDLWDSNRQDHEHNLPPHLRHGLLASVCGPSTKKISSKEQWLENKVSDKSLNKTSKHCDKEQERIRNRTRNTSTASYSNIEPTTKPKRHSITAHTTANPPTRKHMFTHQDASRNVAPLLSSSDETRNIGCELENTLPQLRADFSKLPAHLKSFYVKYSAGKYVGGESRASVTSSNLQHGNGQVSASRDQSTERAKLMAGKPVSVNTETSKIISNTQKDTVFETKGIMADKITRTTPVHSGENSLVFNSANDGSNTVIKDIRGEEPQETWDNQDWNATRRARPKRKEWESETNVSDDSGASDNSAFAKPDSFLHRYVRFWLNAIPQVQRDLFRAYPGEVHEEHDFDPVDGHLIAPVEAPIVVRNEFGLDHPALQQKFEVQTAEWSTKRWLEMIERKLKKQEEQEKQRAYERQVQELAEAKANKGNPYLCRVPAHLRPATEDDMEDVARIYNQEIHEGWRALDQEPQTVNAFTKFLRFCHLEKIPFIVAMSEYRDPTVPVEEANHRVIGFAFLDIASRGVFGSTRSNGKHSARLYVMVDQPYRRNRIGTALIDRMLVMTSRGYMEKEFSYQFENPHNDPVYKPELHNPRQWRIIQMEVYIENLGNLEATKAGEEYRVAWDVFEDFAMARHTSNYGIDERHGHKYLDRLLFEHRCRDSDGNWEPEH